MVEVTYQRRDGFTFYDSSWNFVYYEKGKVSNSERYSFGEF